MSLQQVNFVVCRCFLLQMFVWSYVPWKKRPKRVVSSFPYKGMVWMWKISQHLFIMRLIQLPDYWTNPLIRYIQIFTSNLPTTHWLPYPFPLVYSLMTSYSWPDWWFFASWRTQWFSAELQPLFLLFPLFLCLFLWQFPLLQPGSEFH